MIRLFIDVNNDNTFSEEVEVVLESRLVQSLDESRDYAIVAIKSTKQRKSYKPFTMVKLTEMDGTTLIDYMCIAKDNGGIFGRSFNPTTNEYEIYWKHELRLEQSTYLATRYLCREFVFSQPADNKLSINGTWLKQYYIDYEAPITGYVINESWSPSQSPKGNTLYQQYFKGDRLHMEDNELTLSINYWLYESYITPDNRHIENIITNKTKTLAFSLVLYGSSSDTNGEITQDVREVRRYSFSYDIKPNDVLPNGSFKKDIKIPTETFVDFKRYNYYFFGLSVFIADVQWEEPTFHGNWYWLATFNYSLNFTYFNYIHREVIEKLANCTPIGKKYDIERGYHKPLFRVPQTINGIDLDAPSPQLNISQSNLFDAISQWANYFSAIPKFNKANDTADFVLDLEFPNVNSGAEIDQNKINSLEFEMSNDDGSYKQAQLAVLKNITTDEDFIFPSDNGFASVRSGTYGIVDSEDLRIELPHNIKEVSGVYIPVKVSLIGQHIGYTPQYYDEVLDLSYFIVEKSVYDLLPDTFSSNDTERYKTNCLYYEKGTNYIPIGTTTNPSGYWEGFTLENVIKSAIDRKYGTINAGFQYIWSPQDVWHALFRVKYTPLVNSLRVRAESEEKKVDGEVLANQGSNQINVYRASNNLFGLANRTGVEAINASFKFSKWDNRIKKGDYFINEDGIYYANLVTYVFYRDYIESFISFTKNFNRMSAYVGVDREKRFYEADNVLTKLSEDQINEYIYFALEDETDSKVIQLATTKGYICVQEPFIYKVAYSFLGDSVSDYYSDFAKSAVLLSSIDTSSRYEQFINGEWQQAIKTFTYGTMLVNGSTLSYQDVFIPSFVYYGKNQMTFHVEMREPISAGSYIFGDENNYKNSKVISYTDAIGNFEYVDVNFESFKGSDLEKETAITQYIPFLFNTDTRNQYSEEIIVLKEVAFFKDTNEIFSMDYNLVFVKEDKNLHNIFFGEKLFSDSVIFKGANTKGIGAIWLNADTNYTRYDTKGKGTRYAYPDNDQGVKVTMVKLIVQKSTSDQTTAFALAFYVNRPASVSSWNNFAICDENDNILIAVNRPQHIVPSSNSMFYMFSQQKRL